MENSMKVKVKSLSCVLLFLTPWTVACQAPLTMAEDFPGKNTGVGCHPGDLPLWLSWLKNPPAMWDTWV